MPPARSMVAGSRDTARCSSAAVRTATSPGLAERTTKSSSSTAKSWRFSTFCLGLDQQQRRQSRRLGIVAQVAAHGDAAFVGEVDDDDVGMRFLDRLERVAAAPRFEHIEPVRRQALAELASELLIGLDQHHVPPVATRVHGYAVTSRVPAVPTAENEGGARA